MEKARVIRALLPGTSCRDFGVRAWSIRCECARPRTGRFVRHIRPEAWVTTHDPTSRPREKEHDALVALLRASGSEVWYHDEPQKGKADAIFVHDPVT